MSGFEELARQFNTVGALWHDAYCQWQVVADGPRRTFDDCRIVGWGDTLDEAVTDLLSKRPRPEDASNA